MTGATVNHVTCSQEIRAQNHKLTTAKWWHDPEWRKVKDAFLEKNQVCAFCGGVANVVHHDEDWMYSSREAYFDPANFTPACHKCHGQYRLGRVICPVCGKHYMAKGAEKCYVCRGIKRPGIKKPYRFRSKHACEHRHGRQQCHRDGRIRICAYSSKTGRERCEDFKERVNA